MEASIDDVPENWFDSCPVCQDMGAAECEEFLQDGEELFWRYKLVGKFAKDIEDLQEIHQGELYNIWKKNPGVQLTGLYDVVFSLFSESLPHTNLWSPSATIIQTAFDFKQVNDRQTDKNKTLAQMGKYVYKALIEPTYKVSDDDLMRAGVQTALDLGKPPYDSKMKKVSYAHVSKYIESEFDCKMCRYFDIMKDNQGPCGGESRCVGHGPDNFMTYPLLRLVRFIHTIETGGGGDLEVYQYGVYAWLRRRFEETEGYGKELPFMYGDKGRRKTKRFLFILLLSMKLHQMTRTIDRCPKQEQQNQICNSFLRRCEKQSQVHRAQVDYHILGEGAFCLESTVFETIYILDQLIHPKIKTVFSELFNVPSIDPKKNFEKLAKAVKQHIQTIDGSQRALESRDGKSAKSSLKSYNILLMVLLTEVLPGEDANEVFKLALARVNPALQLDAVNERINDVASLKDRVSLREYHGQSLTVKLVVNDISLLRQEVVLQVQIDQMHSFIQAENQQQVIIDQQLRQGVSYLTALNKLFSLADFYKTGGVFSDMKALNLDLITVYVRIFLEKYMGKGIPLPQKTRDAFLTIINYIISNYNSADEQFRDLKRKLGDRLDACEYLVEEVRTEVEAESLQNVHLFVDPTKQKSYFFKKAKDRLADLQLIYSLYQNVPQVNKQIDLDYIPDVDPNYDDYIDFIEEFRSHLKWRDQIRDELDDFVIIICTIQGLTRPQIDFLLFVKKIPIQQMFQRRKLILEA